MMKASFKARYDTDKATASSTVAFNAGDFKLRASMTEATVIKGPSLNGLALAVEKPGSFIIDYNVPKKDIRFQFMNSVKVLEKPLNLNYIHCHGDNRTILDGTLVVDSANKVAVNHVMGSGSCKLKYTYVHGGITTFEPIYDTAKNAWDFMVSRKAFGDDVFRATYQTTSRNLGLEWSRSSKLNGSFKLRVPRKQTLYLYEVVRSAYTLPSPDSTCGTILGMLLLLPFVVVSSWKTVNFFYSIGTLALNLLPFYC